MIDTSDHDRSITFPTVAHKRQESAAKDAEIDRLRAEVQAARAIGGRDALTHMAATFEEAAPGLWTSAGIVTALRRGAETMARQIPKQG